MLSTLECVLIRPIAKAKQTNLQYSLYSLAGTHAHTSMHAEQKNALKSLLQKFTQTQGSCVRVQFILKGKIHVYV